jgi:hypothetical protein
MGRGCHVIWVVIVMGRSCCVIWVVAIRIFLAHDKLANKVDGSDYPIVGPKL